MKELLIQIKNSDLPKYQSLASAIRTAIKDGKVMPGEVLPASRNIAMQFNMNRHTVMSALKELEAEGWIVAVEKKHYQVVETLPSTFLKPKSVVNRTTVKEKGVIDFVRSSEISDYVSDHHFKHAFRSGYPDTRLFPMKEFKSHLYDALQSQSVLCYGDPAGHPRLIEQIKIYLRRVRNVSDREIVVTNGSQEAIFLLAQVLLKPGDFVAIEILGYPPATEAFKFAGAKLLPIEIDHEGMVIESLEQHLKHKKIKMIYTTPLHQYPTTVTLSATRRLQLYELAYKHNILILEDDYDHEFHYASQPIAPLASFDPAEIVLYVSTFSKVLFPSARVGFMAIPNRVKKEISKLKRISSRQNEQILQETIARWMESGGLEKHLRKMRRVYEERRNEFIKNLEIMKQKRPKINWLLPDGGMALWLDTGQSSKSISEKAIKNGILVSPEFQYRIDGNIGTHLRLGFSGQTVEENRVALKELSKVLG